MFTNLSLVRHKVTIKRYPLRISHAHFVSFFKAILLTIALWRNILIFTGTRLQMNGI